MLYLQNMKEQGLFTTDDFCFLQLDFLVSKRVAQIVVM